jgi:hypothetical protein
MRSRMERKQNKDALLVPLPALLYNKRQKKTAGRGTVLWKSQMRPEKEKTA